MHEEVLEKLVDFLRLQHFFFVDPRQNLTMLMFFSPHGTKRTTEWNIAIEHGYCCMLGPYVPQYGYDKSGFTVSDSRIQKTVLSGLKAVKSPRKLFSVHH